MQLEPQIHLFPRREVIAAGHLPIEAAEKHLTDALALTQSINAFEGRHGYRPISACDNTMLGPIFQHPIREGIDLSLYSLTKYVGGHSDLIAGATLGGVVSNPVVTVAAKLMIPIMPPASYALFDAITYKLFRDGAQPARPS